MKNVCFREVEILHKMGSLKLIGNDSLSGANCRRKIYSIIAGRPIYQMIHLSVAETYPKLLIVRTQGR